MISFMFKALMVLTFGVISNKVCYTLVCFYMLFFFGYTTLLFVEDYLNKLQRK